MTISREFASVADLMLASGRVVCVFVPAHTHIRIGSTHLV